jgi:histidinol-phosphate aminotransferase
MTGSRRSFLGYAAGIAAAIKCPLKPGSEAAMLDTAQPKQPDGIIRLNCNESAYGPSAKVVEVINSAIGETKRYPSTQCESLVEQIAWVHHLRPEQVLLGCGSTEIFRVAASAFLGNGKQLLLASPTFDAIKDYAGAVGAQTIPVPLTPRFAHDVNSMVALANASTTLVYICNPNNPTASLTARQDLETFIGKLPRSTFVVIDEAYHHYVRRSAMYASFIDRPIDDDRVVVARTFSTVYGLAGLRVGYAVGSARTIQQMRKFVTRDNINAIATHAAAAALNDNDAVSEFVEQNANDRQEFFNQAMARSLKPIDSHANFVMMNSFRPAEETIEHFRKNNILIGPHFPQMDTFIRVSLGRQEEMRAFWSAWDLLPRSKNMLSH